MNAGRRKMLKILNCKSVKAIMAGLGALAFVLVCWIYESYVSHGGNITSAHEIFRMCGL